VWCVIRSRCKRRRSGRRTSLRTPQPPDCSSSRSTAGCSCGVQKLDARLEKSPICRQDANLGTPHGRASERLSDASKLAISPRQPRPRGLPAEDRQLAPKDEHLHLLRAAWPSQQPPARTGSGQRDTRTTRANSPPSDHSKRAEPSESGARETRNRVRASVRTWDPMPCRRLSGPMSDSFASARRTRTRVVVSASPQHMKPRVGHRRQHHLNGVVERSLSVVPEYGMRPVGLFETCDLSR
jgi:hypothetical protein